MRNQVLVSVRVRKGYVLYIMGAIVQLSLP